ncbi:hypothetical protein KC19_5G030400, partial [Ceratodon purpureus]
VDTYKYRLFFFYFYPIDISSKRSLVSFTPQNWLVSWRLFISSGGSDYAPGFSLSCLVEFLWKSMAVLARTVDYGFFSGRGVVGSITCLVSTKEVTRIELALNAHLSMSTLNPNERI